MAHLNTDTIVGSDDQNWTTYSPYFGADGSVRFDRHSIVWAWTSKDGWHRLPDAARSHRDDDWNFNQEPPASAASISGRQGPAAMDTTGGYWFTANGMLYRAKDGVCAAQFEAGSAQPFADHRYVHSVILDRSGAIFLQTDWNNPNDYVIVAADASAQHSAYLQVVRNVGTHVTVRVVSPSADADGSHIISVDNGPWSPVEQGSVLHYDYLAQGRHTVWARFYNRWGDKCGSAPLILDVAYDADSIIAKDVNELLVGSDSTRNAAVADLGHYSPALVLEAIKNARSQATDATQRWWLDVASQAASTAPRDTGK